MSDRARTRTSSAHVGRGSGAAQFLCLHQTKFDSGTKRPRLASALRAVWSGARQRRASDGGCPPPSAAKHAFSSAEDRVHQLDRILRSSTRSANALSKLSSSRTNSRPRFRAHVGRQLPWHIAEAAPPCTSAEVGQPGAATAAVHRRPQRVLRPRDRALANACTWANLTGAGRSGASRRPPLDTSRRIRRTPRARSRVACRASARTR
ncbi:MAG: hypothetical protein JWO36_3259 [Myxococcales bacterium]|nr:hypothetical protein [Myxococcales bacterium]